MQQHSYLFAGHSVSIENFECQIVVIHHRFECNVSSFVKSALFHYKNINEKHKILTDYL